MLVTGLYILQACNTNHSNDRIDKAIAANEKKDNTSMTSDTKKDTMTTIGSYCLIVTRFNYYAH